jgi:hypothetical protein
MIPALKQPTVTPLPEETQPRYRYGRRLSRVAQFCAKYPAFTIGSVRWLIFNAKANGFDRVLVRMGPRRIFIDEDRFFEWLDQQQPQHKASTSTAAARGGDEGHSSRGHKPASLPHGRKSCDTTTTPPEASVDSARRG